MNVFPIIFVGFCIFFSVFSMRMKKQQEEARRSLREQAAAKAAAQQSSSAPKPPTAQRPAAESRVQVPTASARATITARTQAQSAAGAEHAVSASASAAAYEAQKHKTVQPEKKGTQIPQKPFLQWNSNSALQGIVYAEILGKPKALRK